MKSLIDKLERNSVLSKDEYTFLISSFDNETSEYLFEKARNIREKYYSKDVYTIVFTADSDAEIKMPRDTDCQKKIFSNAVKTDMNWDSAHLYFRAVKILISRMKECLI